MRFKQTKHPIGKMKYRTYSPTSLTNAYLGFKNNGLSVRRASKQFNVPITTLRDRVLGKIDADCVSTGRPPLFSLDDEVKLVNHLKEVATYGYGYTRAEVAQVASEYAIQIGTRRLSDTPLTRGWLEGFFKRWPELKVLRPRSLELVRAKSASMEKIDKYFSQLSDIIKKYNLEDKPHLIFNVDEKGVSPNHTPPYIVAPADIKVQSVTSGKSDTTIIIGCGSASGTCIPPYFIFKGKRWNSELLNEGTPGVSGTLSETGWSNSLIFRDYLENHFLKYVPAHENNPILLLMDGHSTHISVGLLEWAKSKNIVIFILPAHTSHILQPLDVSCFGPFQRMYNNLCHKTMRLSSSDITRYNICEISCKVYNKALSADNLISGFKSTGIFPTNRSVISDLATKPSEVFVSTVENVPDVVHVDKLQSVDHVEETNDIAEPDLSVPEDFFESKVDKIKKLKSGEKVKPRKCVSKLTSGKPVTEDENLQLIKNYEAERNKPKNKDNKSAKGKGKSKKSQVRQSKKTTKESNKEDSVICGQLSPKPGPSHVYIDSSEENGTDSDSEIKEDEKCCVCNKFTPDEVRKAVALIFTKWVQCCNEECGHWVHLVYCTPKRVIRRGDVFYCTHCTDQ